MNELGNISIRALLIFIDVYRRRICGTGGKWTSASQVSRVIHQMEDVSASSFFTAIPGR